jgi:hypothetical protein
VPDRDTLGQFANVQALVERKPPIGYFAIIRNEIASTTTATPTFQFDADIGSLLPFQLLYDPFRWLAGMAFVVYMYNRIKYLNL